MRQAEWMIVLISGSTRLNMLFVALYTAFCSNTDIQCSVVITATLLLLFLLSCTTSSFSRFFFIIWVWTDINLVFKAVGEAYTSSYYYVGHGWFRVFSKQKSELETSPPPLLLLLTAEDKQRPPLKCQSFTITSKQNVCIYFEGYQRR